ncbi:MAG: 50S ribosomal protein L29 [Ruminococcaceae bacterium]|nr:50S ribosomal protein L29 [Oscillospiraceae bacterium]
MKINEIREKTTEELNAELREKKDALLHLRFQHAINQLDNPQKIVETKKDIARIMTIIREKELAESKQN